MSRLKPNSRDKQPKHFSNEQFDDIYDDIFGDSYEFDQAEFVDSYCQESEDADHSLGMNDDYFYDAKKSSRKNEVRLKRRSKKSSRNFFAELNFS